MPGSRLTDPGDTEEAPSPSGGHLRPLDAKVSGVGGTGLDRSGRDPKRRRTRTKRTEQTEENAHKKESLNSQHDRFYKANVLINFKEHKLKSAKGNFRLLLTHTNRATVTWPQSPLRRSISKEKSGMVTNSRFGFTGGCTAKKETTLEKRDTPNEKTRPWTSKSKTKTETRKGRKKKKEIS